MIDNRRGILAMSASVVVFIFNDALIKLAAETMPPLQAIGLRGCFATLWCVLALLARGELRHAHMLRDPLGGGARALEAAAAISYLVALAYIPFAIATAINMSTPLFLASLAVLLLGEIVGWRRWTRDRRRLRRRADGDPAASRRGQRLDLDGGGRLVRRRDARRDRPLGAAARADAGRVAELGGHARGRRLRLGDAQRLAADEPARRAAGAGLLAAAMVGCPIL